MQSSAQRIADNRRFPPYAAQVPAQVKTVWISAGPDAWSRAQRWKSDGTPGLVLPPGDNPADYIWPVEKFNVALIATDMPPDEAAALVRELMDAGAEVIAVLYGPSANSRMELITGGKNV